MNEKLKIWVRTLLLEYCQTVKYRKASPADGYPRIVFKIDIWEQSEMEAGVLTIWVWNNNESTVELDGIADKLKHKLSGLSYLDDNFYIFFDDARVQIEDDTKLFGSRITVNYHYKGKEQMK